VEGDAPGVSRSRRRMAKRPRLCHCARLDVMECASMKSLWIVFRSNLIAKDASHSNGKLISFQPREQANAQVLLLKSLIQSKLIRGASTVAKPLILQWRFNEENREGNVKVGIGSGH